MEKLEWLTHLGGHFNNPTQEDRWFTAMEMATLSGVNIRTMRDYLKRNDELYEKQQGQTKGPRRQTTFYRFILPKV